MNIYEINGTWELDKRLEALGSIKVDVFALNNHKETPLTHCVKNGLTEFIQPLIDQGSDINHVSGYGWTPLMSAIENHAFDIADILIKNKSDIHKVIKNNFNAFAFAVMKVEIDTFGIAQQLVDLNIDTHLVSTYGKTPLMACIEEINLPACIIDFICKTSKDEKEIYMFMDEIKDMKVNENHILAMDTLKSILLFHKLDGKLSDKVTNKVNTKI